MKAILKLMMALAMVSAVNGGAAWANGEVERQGSNATPGGAAAASTPEEVRAFFREIEQRMQQPGGAVPERRAPVPPSAPQSSRSPAPRIDASRQGANIADEAVSASDLPIVPRGPAMGRQGAGTGNPTATQPCARCVAI
jgi:hypothetical protein